MLSRLTIMAMLGSYCMASYGLGIPVHEVTAQEKNSVGKKIGTIHFEDTSKGLKISTNIHGLSPGPKGFHIHENPSCEANVGADKKWTAAGAAGGHLDPNQSGKHLGPNHEGHLGDLPVLEVNAKGVAKQTVVVSKLRVKEITGHSIVIHQKGDNYSDQPEKLGGGGPRIACGVISAS